MQRQVPITTSHHAVTHIRLSFPQHSPSKLHLGRAVEPTIIEPEFSIVLGWPKFSLILLYITFFS
jgi:hypothetical protein